MQDAVISQTRARTCAKKVVARVHSRALLRVVRLAERREVEWVVQAVAGVAPCASPPTVTVFMLASSRLTLSFAHRDHVSQSTRERAMTVWTRIKLAFAAFFTILFKGRLPTALQPAARAEAPSQPVAADPHDRAVQYRKSVA